MKKFAMLPSAGLASAWPSFRRRCALAAALAAMLLGSAATAHADNWSAYRIMLDPGHGGSDPGASGPSAPHEATLCLRAANALASKFSALGAPYKLTRTTDATLSLSARRSMSVSYDPYIFCSIHLNAFNGSANGIETWYYWSSGNSQTLANKVQASLVSQLGRVNRGVKQNGWTVITGSASVPAILTEGLFVDNYTEWSMIKDAGSSGFNAWVNGHLFGFYDHLKTFNANITNPRNGVGTPSTETPSTPTPSPTLSVNASSWSFSCEAGQVAMATFSATKANTTESVTVTSNNSAFVVSLVTQHSSGAYFDLKFAPSAAGSYSGTITVKCGSLSKTLSVTGTATAPPPAYLSLNYSNWSFSARAGETQMATFSATRVNTSATDAVTVTSDNSAFYVEAVSQASFGAWFNIQYRPTTSGTHTGTITVKSGSLTTTMSVTGVATAKPLYFKEKWNFSDYNNTATFRGWDATKVRNMTYGNGKLYLVYDESDIKVVNAQTGEDLGNLNKINMTGGTVPVADVKFCDGRLVASNIAVAANGDKLRVYTWESDQLNPGLLLETDQFGGAPRIGDCIGWRGTWTDGQLVFANDDGTTSRLIIYNITNGSVTNKTSPVVVTLKNADGTRFATTASTRPYPQANGDYWVTGQGCPTTYFNSSGVRQYCIDQDVEWGNAFTWFNWDGQRYGMYTTYEPYEGESLGSQTAEQKAKNYTKGRFRLFSYDGSWDNTTDIYDYPSWGLSEKNQNSGCTSNVIASVTENAVETWVLIANQGIAYYVNHGGTPPSYDLESVESTMPEIRTSATQLNLTAKEGKGAELAFTVSGVRLRDAISLKLQGADAAAFALDIFSIPKAAEYETVTISYNADAVGEHAAELVLSTQYAPDVTVKLTGQTTETKTLGYEINQLEQRWLYSELLGNATDSNWYSHSGDAPTRDIALANWKIYALQSKPWGTPQIVFTGAYDGASLRGSLSMTGISGGETTLASICSLGGIIIGSNGARCAGFQHTETTTDVLKVYRWLSDDAEPEIWLQDPVHGDTHVGEIMSVSGNMTSGNVMFSDGSKVLVYAVTDGTISQEARVITLTRDGEPVSVGDIKGTTEVTMMPDGTFWLTGKNSYPTHFAADGSFIEELSSTAFSGNQYGTSTAFFSVGPLAYAAGITYLDKNSALSLGSMAVVNITDGVEAASTLCVYPEDGLGSTANTSFQSRVLHEESTDGERHNLWVLVPGQGVGFYKFDAAAAVPSQLGGTAMQPGATEWEYFTLQGVRVDARNLAPGIYIRRCGNRVEKILF